MNWMRFATGLMMLLLLLHGIVTTVPGAIVGGEGSTNDQPELNTFFREENREEPDPGIPLIEGNRLMYITVDNTTEMRIDLFLDPVAMGPREMIVLKLTVNREPTSISIQDLTADEFRTSHDLGHIERVAKRQSGVGHAIASGFSDYSATLFGSAFLPAGLMYLVDSEEGHSYGYYDDSQSTSFVGTSMQLDSVEYINGDGATEFSGNHSTGSTDSALFLNFTTTSPISDDEYIDLAENYPKVMRNLTEFVRKVKSQDLGWRNDVLRLRYYRVDREFWNISNDFDARSTELNRTYGIPLSSTYGYRTTFSKLVALLYGYGEVTGTAVSITLPISEDTLLIPLLYSFLNESIDPESRLELVIDADDSLSLDLDEGPNWEAFEDGRHYSHFTINTSREASGISISGSIEKDSEFWNERGHRLNGSLYTNRFPILLVIFTIGAFLFAYFAFTNKFEEGIQWNDWTIILPLVTATLLGTVFGGFALSLFLCMLGFSGSFYSRNNLKILLGPAAADIPTLTMRERSFRPLWGIALITAGLFFFIALLLVSFALFSIQSYPGAFLTFTFIFVGSSVLLGFVFERNRKYGPGFLNSAQRKILGRIMPAFATQTNDSLANVISILIVALVIVPLSLVAAATTLFWLFDNVSGWVVFSLSLSFCILVNGYLLILLRDLEVDRQRRDRFLYSDIIESHPEIEDHISWVKWLGPDNVVKLMSIPSRWDDQNSWIYTLNNPVFTCPFNCEPVVQRHFTCRITWDKLYSALKFPERYRIAHRISDRPRMHADSS
jgi:hypothetical protein